MSLDMLNGKVRLYNYEQSPVSFPSQHSQNGVFIRGRDEDEEFVVERVALDDIEVENSKSDLFKVGRLRFHPDEENELYLKLGIEDRENILNNSQITELLLVDSIETVKKISNLKSSTLIKRMKSALFTLERAGKIPPANITAAVIERANELKNGGKRNPNSEINRILDLDKKADQEGKLKETLDQLMKKVESLEKEAAQKDDIISKSQFAIEQLLTKVESLTGNQLPTDNSEETKRQAGRPPKSR